MEETSTTRYEHFMNSNPLCVCLSVEYRSIYNIYEQVAPARTQSLREGDVVGECLQHIVCKQGTRKWYDLWDLCTETGDT